MTKMICTVGPATSDATTVGRMMDAGLPAARINMSHNDGSHEQAGAWMDVIRSVAGLGASSVPSFWTPKVPRFECAGCPGKHWSWKVKTKWSCSRANTLSRRLPPLPNLPKHQAVITYPYLARAVRQGDIVLLDDGRISLLMVSINNDDCVHTQVITRGRLVNRKGVNLPDCHVELPHLTAKDEQDILFGVSKRVEYIAHSFTRNAIGINQV